MTAPATHTALLDKLCDLFDDELERQETILSLCRSQTEAARAHDVDRLAGQG